MRARLRLRRFRPREGAREGANGAARRRDATGHLVAAPLAIGRRSLSGDEQLRRPGTGARRGGATREERARRGAAAHRGHDGVDGDGWGGSPVTNSVGAASMCAG
jgi:hypothetical protein